MTTSEGAIARMLENIIHGGHAGLGMSYRGHRIFRDMETGGYAITVPHGEDMHRVIEKGNRISDCLSIIDAKGDWYDGAHHPDQ